MEIVVRVPGSCGELVQGSLAGKSFLVTCPIDCYTEVRISDAIEGIHGLGRKSLMSLVRTMSLLGKEEFPFGIQLTSELPHGKGMASSSADISAVASAVSIACGIPLSFHQILQLASAIEPTDGTFLPNIVRLDYLSGEIIEHFSHIPTFQISIFDTGGEIDTVMFNQQEDLTERVAQKEFFMRKALNLLRQGTDESIAEAATISALAHQNILHKDHLSEILEFVKREGALGVCIAHSGTVLGVLWHNNESEKTDLNNYAMRIAAKFPHLTYIKQTHLIPGGIYRII